MGTRALEAKRLGWVSGAVAAILWLPFPPGGQCAEPEAPIPVVRGVALSGEAVALPDAFAGKKGVLVVGFSQASRTEVTAWGKRLAHDYRDSPLVVYYEVPILASVPRLLRGLVLKKVSAEVPDRARARFLPVYDHEPEWRAAAGYSRADDAYVLVVDSTGVVRFRLQGDANDASYAEMKKHIEDIK